MSQTNARLQGGGAVLPVGSQIGPVGAGEFGLIIDSDGALKLVLPSGAKSAVGATAVNVRNYGAVGDTQLVVDGVATNGSKVVTSPTANFQQSARGKTAWLNNTSTGANILAPTTITDVDSATQIRVAAAATGSGTGALAWGTDDTAAFKRAYADVAAAQSTVIGAPAGAIYAPTGCYMVGDRWYDNLAAYQAGKQQMPCFFGDGKTQTTLMMMPNTPIDGGGLPLLMLTLGTGGSFSGFRIHGGYRLFPTVSDQDVWRFTQAGQFSIADVDAIGIGGSSASNAISFRGSGPFTLSRMYFVNTVIMPANVMTAMKFDGANGFHARDVLPSNWYANAVVQNNTGRTPLTGPSIWEGWGIDEGGYALQIIDGDVLLRGMFVYSGLAEPDLAAVTLAGASRLVLDGCNLGRFGAPAPGTAIKIGVGSSVFSRNTVFRGDSTGAAHYVINSGTFVNHGGNEYRKYTGANTYVSEAPAACFTGSLPIDPGSPGW